MHYGEDGDEWRQRMVDELVPDPPPGVVDSLAVIGNGFDLALGIPSSFTQFKEYFRLLVLGAQDIDAELVSAYDPTCRSGYGLTCRSVLASRPLLAR